MVEKHEYLPSDENIRKAMELAWRDHHHARDQTWKTVQIVAGFGVLITWHHRKLERRKFIHLMNCEEILGLHRDDIIPFYPENDSIKDKSLLIQDSAVKVPNKFKLFDIINPFKQNTALFILRIHLAIMVFAIHIATLRYSIG